MSALPEISSVAASSSPEIVIFLPPVMSMFASAIRTLLAMTVPFVMPSIRLMSAALAVTAVPFKDSASVSSVPSMSTFPDISKLAAVISPPTVRVVRVPRLVILDCAAPVTVAAVPVVSWLSVPTVKSKVLSASC